MSREWNGIEALRMDKFLYLVRCFLNASFAYAARDAWRDQSVREELLGMLREVPLSARDVKVPNGLRYHVVDIYIDELDKVDTDRTAPVEEMLEPLRRLGKDGLTKAVRKRVNDELEDDRVGDWKGEKKAESGDDEEKEDKAEMEDDSENEDDGFGGFDD